MDVLLGSIDVRDLLSTEDLDESSPLSAPDLRLLVDRLQIRSLHIKSKVRDYVLSHHRDFADIFSRCAASAAGVNDAAAALANVFFLLSDRPFDGDICDIVKEIGRKRQELEEQKEALAVVRTVSTLLKRLKAVSDDIRAGRLVKAAVDVRDLKIGLRFSEVEDNKRVEEEPAFYGFLRKEWLDCFEEDLDKEKNHALIPCGFGVKEIFFGIIDRIRDVTIQEMDSPAFRFHKYQNAVPEDAAKMAEFEDIIMEFENSLKEMQFISYDNNNEQTLSHFAHNVEVHFACRKKCEILAKARDILLQFNSLNSRALLHVKQAM
ncbi:hypothetical protein HPP92_028624 [Vanilla planifolia]|uniref:Centromere/kinetochore protein zw10 middle domain-containing protein n=1 Tax=Vanilla planifolia TaxID=51239 RepID=A0A835U3E0_VANPL|nr:hypothetical protein HPP92_028624 [Vanilla planifolia]